MAVCQAYRCVETTLAQLQQDSNFKKGCRALDVGISRAYALINQLSVHEPVDWLCKVFEVPRSCYYAQRLRRRTPDVERLRLRSRVSELFSQSRSAAGSRSILSLMRDDGEQLGRFKVRSLMRELDLISKQPFQRGRIYFPKNGNKSVPLSSLRRFRVSSR